MQLTFTPSLTPAQHFRPFPSCADLIPVKPPPPKFLPSKDPDHDFRRQIKLAARAVAAEYHSMFAEQLVQPPDKSAAETRKETFLYDFNLSGKSQVLKTKLKKSIVKIARERLSGVESLKGLSFTAKDRHFTELYAHLIAQINVTLTELFAEQREKLHEVVFVPKSQARKENELNALRALQETPEDRLLRLANEAELKGDLHRAIRCHQKRIDRNPQDTVLWLEYSAFLRDQQNYEGAEACLIEVVALQGPESSLADLFLLCSLLMQLGKYAEGSIVAHSAVTQAPESLLGNLLVYSLYSNWGEGHEGLAQKYFAIAKKLIMVHLGVLVHELDPVMNGICVRATEEGQLGDSHFDDMHYGLVEYFIEQKLAGLAGGVLGKITDQQSSLGRYLFCSAQIKACEQNYEASVEILNELLNIHGRHEDAWVLQGNNHFYLENYLLAEECFLKAIRYLSKSHRHIHVNLLLKLAQIYVKRESWADALIVSTQSAAQHHTATALEIIGLSSLQLGKMKEAEHALIRASVLDAQNADTWLSLALLSLKCTISLPGRYFEYKQFLKNALRLRTVNVKLLVEVGNEYIEKIFLEGVENFVEKFDCEGVLECFLRAAQSVQGEAESSAFIAGHIKRKFEELKERDDNSLDSVLIENIETAKTRILKEVTTQSSS